MSLDPARRAGLERSRAQAIARDHFALEPADVVVAPFGVSVIDGDRAVVVTSSSDLSALGGVLVFAARRGLADVAFVSEHHPGVHARRAARLAPHVAVHQLNGSEIAAATPEPIAAAHPTPDDVAPLIDVIESTGADVVVEDGIVRAEVAGLEVARVVTGPEGSAIEVGVGRFDREAGALLHAERPTEATLVDTIRRVEAHRRTGAVSHAVNRIGRSRWLRSVVMNDLGQVGLEAATLVEPVPPRTSLLEARSAALVGHDPSGVLNLVMCSVGIDLGVVPEAADLVAVTGAERVVLAMPERDQLPAIRDLAELLPEPTTLVSIDVPWID